VINRLTTADAQIVLFCGMISYVHATAWSDSR